MSQEQFAKAAIRMKLKIEDPEVYEKLVDVIYKFSMVMLYGDTTLRRQAIDALFSVLPEDLVLQVLSDYVVRTMNRYRKLAEIAMSLVPRTSSARGIEDAFMQMAMEMFKNQMMPTQAMPQMPQQQQGQTVVSKVPEELKKLLE
jgi:hypothetical protein